MRMDEIVVSAPGKVILHGEHAVVYGKKALAASLDLRSYMRLRTLPDDCEVRITLPDIDVSKSWSKTKLETSLELPLCAASKPVPASENLLSVLHPLASLTDDISSKENLALVAFLYLYCSLCPKDGKLQSIDLLLASSLPHSAGLGSSAAYTVCIAAGLLELIGEILRPNEPSGNGPATCTYRPQDLDLINAWSLMAEKIIHGNSSGIDNAVSTHGGALCFKAGKITTLQKIPALKVLMTNTKVPRCTKVLVAAVKTKYNKYPAIIKPIIDSIEAIVTRCEEVFLEMAHNTTEEHFYILKELIVMNQCHLTALGTSHIALEEVIQLTAAHGFATKLTGAGGGGCAFTLLPPGTDELVLDKVKDDLTRSGFVYWDADIGKPGVQRIFNRSQLHDAPQIFLH